MSYRLPQAWGGIETGQHSDYLDGLPSDENCWSRDCRRDRFWSHATPRGTSPQGGYRAERVVNWNLRLRRDFHVPGGRLSGALDILNVLDSDASLQENDITGPTFLLAVAGGGSAPAQFAHRGAITNSEDAGEAAAR